IFEQINGVYKKVDDLTEIISKIGRGALSELRIGSVPSISQVMVPRAIERVRRRYPQLRIDINILKIEEAVDYLLLDRGDCVAMIDQFTVAHGGYPGVELLRIVEPTKFDTYIAVKRGAPLSLYIEHFIDCLRTEMRAVGTERSGAGKPAPRIRKK